MSKLEQLEKLHQLRKEGAITEEEFQKLKAEAMGETDWVQKATDATTEINQKVSQMTSEVKFEDWAMFIHLSLLINFVAPLLGILLPVILWQMKKDQSEFIDEQGQVVVNWILTSLVIGAIGFVLTFILIGQLVLFALLFMNVAFPIIGALEAKKGRTWKYPLSIQFIR